MAKRLESAPKVATDLGPLVEAAHTDGLLGPLLAKEMGPIVAQGSMIINQSAVGTDIGQVGSAGGDVTFNA